MFLKHIFTINYFNYSGALEAFLCTLLEVIKKSFQFVKDYQDRKPSYASLLIQNESSIAKENEVLEQFVESLWKVIDQTCVPALMVNCEAIENKAVFKNFFEILHLSVSSLSTWRQVFAQKFASGSFVRLSLEIKEKFHGREESKELEDAIANFVRELCVALGDATDSIQLGKLLKTSNIGGIHSSTACLNLLTQSAVSQGTNHIIDDSLFGTQCACIELMYVSFSHGDEIVPVEHLMTSLHKYLVLHQDLGILPRVSLKHLLCLWMGSYRRLRTLPLPSTVVESMKASQEILEQGLVKFKADEFESIYIHDPLFISWIFSRESLALAFGQQVFICFLKTGTGPDSPNNEELYHLLATNSQSFRTFVSLVDSKEEAITNRVVTILEGLIGDDSDASAKLSMSNQRSLASHITSIFHKLFLSHKANPLQEHSITAMLNVMLAVQMKNLAFDIKLLYHVINLLSSTKCQTFSVAAFNYLNVSLAWDTHRETQRVAAVLLSNKGFCSYVQEILNVKLAKDDGEQRNSPKDVNLLASILILISSLANSQMTAHKDVQDAFRIDKNCMVKLANERQNILGLSSLVFWDSFFRTTGASGNLVLVLSVRTQEKYQPLEKLSDVDLHVLLVYLQNSLVHDSETVRQCALKCLDSFLAYVPNANYFATNPWNKIVLESQLCELSVNVVTSSLVLFCLLILQHAAADKHQLAGVLQNAVRSVIEKLPSIPCSEVELSWQCINLLVQVLSSKYFMPSKGVVAAWLITFKDSLKTNFQESASINESIEGDLKDMKFFKLDAVIFAKRMLKPQVSKSSELIERALLLLDDERDEDAGIAN